MKIYRRSDILKFLFLPLLAIILFIVAVFGYALPTSKNNLLEQKKEMIAVLTQTALNILTHYDRQVRAGKINESTAQHMAAEQIRDLRYGSDGKDYFWITDMKPRMIMHPYRPDLEGQELSDFTDPNGKHLFVEFVREVVTDGSGYVPYLWQWKDVPDQIVPKLSYVKLFKPWGWIIGTGVYLDDVSIEISKMSRQLLYFSLIVTATIFILSLYIIHQGLSEAQRRRKAELELKNYRDHLEVLVKRRTAELQKALSEVKLLSGFLPICSSCKKVRNDKGYWSQIESYIQEHTEAEFSHGFCPDCIQKLYPKFDSKESESNNKEEP